MIVNEREEPYGKSTYHRLETALGLHSTGTPIYSPYDFITLASRGLSTEIVSNFKQYFRLTQSAVAGLLNVSEPTLYRWQKSGQKLGRNHSVQLFELTDLFLFGSDVFESRQNFFKWLDLPNPALGSLMPMELLEIPGGVQKVKDLLGRIEYGVYS